MKLKWVVLCIVVSFFTMAIKAQTSNASATFIVTSPQLPDDSTVYITGGIAQLGNWNPGKVKLDFVGNHTWQIKISVPKSISVEYKYTLGAWDRQAAATDGTPLPNLSARLQNNMIIRDTIQQWTSRTQNKVVEHHITGTVHCHPDMKGKGIKDRDVTVWLPPNYDSSGATTYPVVYMHDGQNIFDPAASAFGVEWGIDEISDSLIANHIIQPFIVVGIYNTSDRSAEYAPGKLGEAYMAFVTKKVKPFIDSAYQTNPDRAHTITGGSSSGGLISFMLAWQYSDVFSKAICMSPAFKINKLDYVKEVVAYKGKKKPLFFYIDNGGIGLESQLQPGVDAMLAALQKKGYELGEDIEYVSQPKANHSEASWAKRFPKAILSCLSSLQSEVR